MSLTTSWMYAGKFNAAWLVFSTPIAMEAISYIKFCNNGE